MYFPLHLAALMYVLTGGPSVGKTSIIKELEKQGEPIIREAATDWIADKLASGVQEFWKVPNMNYQILSLQLEREKPFLSRQGRVFVDRGIFDPFAYVPRFFNAKVEELSLLNAGVADIDLNTRYAAVFFISPYQEEDFTPSITEIRREDAQEFSKIQASLHAIYCRHKNFFIVPGNLSPKERAAFILEAIKKIENQSS